MSQEEKEPTHLYYVTPGEIYDDPDLSDCTKLLYSLLCALANKTGKCFASDEYLAKRRFSDERTIQRSLRQLEDIGYISRETFPDKDNPFKKVRFVYVNVDFKKSLPTGTSVALETYKNVALESTPMANIVSEEIPLVSEVLTSLVPPTFQDNVSELPIAPSPSVGTSQVATFSKESKELAEALLKKIKELHPAFKQPKIDKWSLDMDKMLRVDSRAPNAVLEVLDFAFKDPFWSKTLQSPEKLRKHYDALFIKMNAGNTKPGWIAKNRAVAHECAQSLRADQAPIAKIFFVGANEVTRLDTGEKLSMEKDPILFEAEMLRLFKLRRHG